MLLTLPTVVSSIIRFSLFIILLSIEVLVRIDSINASWLPRTTTSLLGSETLRTLNPFASTQKQVSKVSINIVQKPAFILEIISENFLDFFTLFCGINELII